MDFIDKVLNLFLIEYNNNKGTDFIIANRGKERSAIGKLLKEYKKKDASSEETLKDFQMFFQRCFDIEDKFIKDNISPSIILNQINKIRQIIKEENARVNEVRNAIRIINLQG
jgi:hypothetical protein